MKILAIDIGTTRVKTALFNEHGEMSLCSSISIGRAKSPTLQDANMWYDAVCTLLKKLMCQPDVIALTGNMHALLGVDEKGTPVNDAILWTDNSALKYANELNETYGDFILKSFGNKMIPVFTLPKILMMKAEQGILYEKTYKFLQSKDFITFRLTGRFVTDPSDASGVGCMNLDDFQWNVDFLNKIGLSVDKFPEIVPSVHVCGYVTEKAARETGLSVGIPVVCGAGDLSSAAIGSAINEKTMSLTLGTAGQLLACGAKGGRSNLVGKMFVFAHANPDFDLYLGSVPAGGFNFEWIARIMDIKIEDFFEIAEQSELTERLPVYLPYVLGRGAPYMDYCHCGEWNALSAAHTRADLCLSAIFHTLCPLRQCADLLDKYAGKHDEIIFQSLAERQKIVRLCATSLFPQKTRCVPVTDEASLLGTAVIAAVAMQMYPDFAVAQSKMVRKKRCEDVPVVTAEKLYQRFFDRIEKFKQ